MFGRYYENCQGGTGEEPNKEQKVLRQEGEEKESAEGRQSPHLITAQ